MGEVRRQQPGSRECEDSGKHGGERSFRRAEVKAMSIENRRDGGEGRQTKPYVSNGSSGHPHTHPPGPASSA